MPDRHDLADVLLTVCYVMCLGLFVFFFIVTFTSHRSQEVSSLLSPGAFLHVYRA